jgi:hypothetical protein
LNIEASIFEFAYRELTSSGVPSFLRLMMSAPDWTFRCMGGGRPAPESSWSILRSPAVCWPTSSSIVLPNVPLHAEQSTCFAVLRPPNALSRMCSGLVSPVSSFSKKMHLAIDVLESQLSQFLKLVRAAGLESKAFRSGALFYQDSQAKEKAFGGAYGSPPRNMRKPGPSNNIAQN